MEKKDYSYIFWIVVHIAIGAAIFAVPFLSKIYGYLIVLVGLIYTVKASNREHQALYVCAYIVGSEVLLRMTYGNPLHEFSKYGVIAFMFLAMFYRGFSKSALPYWIFLLLLIPGLVISTQVIDFNEQLRKSISFNISGPLCLGISALYMYNRRMSSDQLNKLLLIMGMPIVSTATYLIFYTPSVRDVVTGTASNFETSGGFGPNQVSTILGLGMFIFFVRLMLFSKSKVMILLNMILFVNLGYRGLVTFSRGGIITGMFMIAIFMFVIYSNLNMRGRFKFHTASILIAFMVAGIWLYSENETGGMINKRYANEDGAGRAKKSQLSGREDIMRSDVEFFMDNPVFGVGVAKSAEMRGDLSGLRVAAHNEVTRMLSEHGTFGIVALLILLFTPLVLYINNKMHILMLCFLGFWLLTLNHAAMRVAAPAFVYALSVLKIYRNEEDSIHREQTL